MSGIGEAAAAAAGPVSQVLSNELEKLRQQSNVQNLEVFGFNMERYQIRERQLVLKTRGRKQMASISERRSRYF